MKKTPPKTGRKLTKEQRTAKKAILKKIQDQLPPAIDVEKLVDAVNEDHNRIHMGIGKIGHPNCVFSRKFRWRMEGTDLPEHFFKKASIDYKNKLISFEYYDVIDDEGGMHALIWALNLDENPTHKLKFSTYDGCGNKLYSCEFSNLRLLSHNSDFDYASSDAACQKISVVYGKVDFQLTKGKNV